VGFNPLRVLRKRNKALRKIRRLIKKGELTVTIKGLQAACSLPIEESEDESNMEDLDQPVDFSGLPVQVNWREPLPANISVPQVDIHSLVLDFSAVSFLDISALKGLKILGMGLLQVGFIVIYLSDTMVSGFTTAAAVHILVSQLKFVLGLTVPGISGAFNIFFTLEKVFTQLYKTNVADLLTSIIIMAAVYIVKEINDKFKLPVPIPIEIIMTIIACGCSFGFNFEERFNVTVIGEMVKGYEPPFAPNVDVMQYGAVDAFPIAIVGFAVAYSVAKVYSVKHDYVIDGNQSVLGALVIVNLKGMLMQFREVPYLWKRDKADFVGFSPLRILRKRNKALRKIRKMLKNGELQVSPRGFESMGYSIDEKSEDESNMEDLDQPVDFSDLPIQT
ncbi:chloride anion exchanger-like, partial [Clarias magur]